MSPLYLDRKERSALRRRATLSGNAELREYAGRRELFVNGRAILRKEEM